jgi:3-hydroxybutyryl-CoA dehydratase
MQQRLRRDGEDAIVIGKTIDQIKLGDAAEFSKTVTEADVVLFAGVTGDLNPAHINETFAADTFFKGRIAHGMLSAGFISAVIGTKLPGPGAIYMSQSLRFTAPVRIGDTVTARAEVIEIIEEKHRVKLSTTCRKQDGTVVLEGEALVMAPRGR